MSDFSLSFDRMLDRERERDCEERCRGCRGPLQTLWELEHDFCEGCIGLYEEEIQRQEPNEP